MERQQNMIPGLDSIEQFTKIAGLIKKHIEDNRLYENIKGNSYVKVEGWQYAGALLGVYPHIESIEDKSEGPIYEYLVTGTLRNARGEVVQRAVSLCSSKETKKRNYDRYAILSMAQTRVVGKMFRLLIGWLINVAGYSTVPAEEMETYADSFEPTNKAVLKEYKAFALQAVKAASTAKNISMLTWMATTFREDAEFIDVAKQAYNDLLPNE